jgi:hypothetical protein
VYKIGVFRGLLGVKINTTKDSISFFKFKVEIRNGYVRFSGRLKTLDMLEIPEKAR